MKEALTNPTFYLIGNQMSLDFLNTVVAQNGAPLDLLTHWTDFVAWAAQAEIIARPQAEEWAREGKGTRNAAALLAQVREFRETLRRIIGRYARGAALSKVDLEKINVQLRAQNGYSELVRSAGAYEKRFRAQYDAPLHLLAPIAESAADLLCYATPAFIKKCENPACVLQFYDTTKNHTRRWCSMQVCGNRAKAAAFYQRSKQHSA